MKKNDKLTETIEILLILIIGHLREQMNLEGRRIEIDRRSKKNYI